LQTTTSGFQLVSRLLPTNYKHLRSPTTSVTLEPETVFRLSLMFAARSTSRIDFLASNSYHIFRESVRILHNKIARSFDLPLTGKRSTNNVSWSSYNLVFQSLLHQARLSYLAKDRTFFSFIALVQISYVVIQQKTTKNRNEARHSKGVGENPIKSI